MPISNNAARSALSRNLTLAAILFAAFAAIAHSQDASWHSDNPDANTFYISNESQLKGLAQLVNGGTSDFSGKTVVLSADIALTSAHASIGVYELTESSGNRMFKGDFDGAGHTVSNYSGTGGFFDNAGGTIKNLAIKGAGTISAGGNGTGGLADYYAGSLIENVAVEVNINVVVEADRYFKYSGGLVGYASGSTTIRDSYFIGDISSAVSSCAASPSLVIYVYSGGLVGYARSLTISGSRAIGNVSSRAAGASDRWLESTYAYSGGLVGYSGYTTISGSHAVGDVSAYSVSAGTNITGGVVSDSYSGGLVGYAAHSLTISGSYSIGDASAYSDAFVHTYTFRSRSYSGGLVGAIGDVYAFSAVPPAITNSYSVGDVSATAAPASSNAPYPSESYSGGLVGIHYIVGVAEEGGITITNSYASGAVTGSHRAGGIFGRYNGGTNAAVFYNSSGASQAAGEGSPSSVYAKTSEQLKARATFEALDWDFNGVWDIAEGCTYPFLKSSPVDFSCPLASVDAAPIPPQPYSSSQIAPKPEIRLKNGGAVLTEDVDYALTYGENKNVGVGTIRVDGIGSHAGILENIFFKITPAPLTVTGASALDKAYDGDSSAVIAGAALEGVLGGDDVSLSNAAVGTFASKNAGSDIAVSTAFALSGADKGNYSLIPPPALSASIFKKTVTVTLNPKVITRTVFDDLPAFDNYLSISGLVGKDTKAVFSGTAQYDHSYVKGASGLGEYPIALSGSLTATNYAPSYSSEGLKLTVTAYSITYAGISVSAVPPQTYAGAQIKPSVSAAHNSAALTEGVDYELSYGANKDVGTKAGSITVSGKGNYNGSRSVNFEITPKALTVIGAAALDKIYDCGASAVISGAMLDGVVGGDDVSLSNAAVGTFANKNVGSGIAVSTAFALSGAGKGNYSLSPPPALSASIAPKTVTVIGAAAQNKTYDGTTSAVISGAALDGVLCGDGVLLANAEVGTFEGKDVGSGIPVSADFALWGSGNYSLSPPPALSASIIPKAFNDDLFALAPATIAPQTYTGSEITPSLAIMERSTLNPLVIDIDYDVSYDKNINVGTAKLTVALKGNYSGTFDMDFTVSPKKIIASMIQGIAGQVYTGEKITPAVVVKYGSVTLEEGVDYFVDYGDNVNGNPGYAVVSGLGNYGGAARRDFTISGAPSVIMPEIAGQARGEALYYGMHGQLLGSSRPKNPGAYIMKRAGAAKKIVVR